MYRNARRSTFVAGIVGCLLLAIGCTNPDTTAWNNAKQQDTPQAYQDYLKEHPKGVYVKRARDAVEGFDSKAWQAAVTENKEDGYRKYLAEFPTGARNSDARLNLSKLLWDKAKQSGTIESYAAYLKEFPDGVNSFEARSKLESLRWEKAEKSGAIEDYAGFVEEFKSSYRADAGWEKIESAWDTARREGKLEGLYAQLKGSPTVAVRLRRGEKFASVREGQGVAEASPREGAGPHPVILLTDKGMLHKWHDEMPATWRTDEVSKTRLVLVLGRHRETVLSVHHYNGPSIKRYQCDLSAVLVEATTGKTLARKDFQNVGRIPGAVEPYHLTRTGDPISRSEVEAWLRIFVEQEVKR